MANYPIPPWLVPPSPESSAAAFTGGLRAGAEIAQQRQQMAMQAHRISLELQMRKEENERQALLEEHKLATADARAQAMFGLQAAKLEQAQQQNQAMLAVNAARLQQGQQRIDATAAKAARSYQFQEEYRRRIAAGEDPRKVAMELGPSISGSMAGMGSLMRQGATLEGPALGSLSPIEGAPPNLMKFRSGAGSYKTVDTTRLQGAGPLPQAQDIPGAPGLKAFDLGNRWHIRSLPRPYVTPEEKALRDKLETKEGALMRARDSGRKTELLEKEIADLNAKLEKFKPQSAAPASPGTNAPTRYRFNPESGMIEPSGGGDFYDEDEEELDEEEEGY